MHYQIISIQLFFNLTLLKKIDSGSINSENQFPDPIANKKYLYFTMNNVTYMPPSIAPPPPIPSRSQKCLKFRKDLIFFLVCPPECAPKSLKSLKSTQLYVDQRNQHGTYGSSEHCAHIWSKSVIAICCRNLITSNESSNSTFYFIRAQPLLSYH